MKPVVLKLSGVKLRLRPGGHLFLRPPLLHKMRWTRADEWLLEFEACRLMLFRKPSEREWRIHRLRTRISSSYAARPITNGFTPRTIAEFLAQKASRRVTSTVITHITPVGGNIFADLGFPPAEAAALLAESDRMINKEATGKDAT